MPTTKTLTLGPHLPAAGSAKAYLDPGWTHLVNPTPSAVPVASSGQSTVAIGAVVDTQTISAAGTVTFVGLTDKREYIAGLDLGSGAWKYIRFHSF